MRSRGGDGMTYFVMIIVLNLLNLVSALAQENQSKNVNYVPVITPNVDSLPWTLDNGVKVFHLIAEPIQREFAPGFLVNC